MVLEDPGLLQLDMARINPVAGGSGSLAEIDLRARDRAGPGSYTLDLELASLNAGGLVLHPAVQPGDDPSDGRVLVEAAPSATPAAPAPSATPLEMAAFDGSVWRQHSGLANQLRRCP